MNKEKSTLIKSIPNEVAQSQMLIKVQGDKITKMQTAGTYKTVMAQMVLVITSLFLNMEKAYGISKDKSFELLEKMLEEAVK